MFHVGKASILYNNLSEQALDGDRKIGDILTKIT